MLSMFNGLQNKGFGRFNTADQLHDYADFRVGKYIVGILGENYLAVTGNVVRQGVHHDIGNFCQPDHGADSFFKPCLLIVQDLSQAASHGSKADQTYFYLLHIKTPEMRFIYF